MSAERILVVEDDESLAIVLKDLLHEEGYRVEVVRDGVEGLKRAFEARFDLVVLDRMLPRLDGVDVCRRIRLAGKRIPILMLTAKGREEDRVAGLDAGADDYVVKPFGTEELLARVRARLRAAKTPLPPVTRVAGAEVDFAAMKVRRDGQTIELTKMEVEVLKFFAHNPGVVLSRNRFLDEVWGYDRFPTTRTVDMHVARVREKVGDVGDEPRSIKTVHGVGYRYDPLPGDLTPA